ncbi:MAG: hypothetical protein ABI630_07835 [Betaproteobacteria bacterium]
MVFDWINRKLKGAPAEELHFLATDAGIEEFQASLPASQPGTALAQICDALDSALGANVEHKAFRRALRTLDKGAQPVIDELTHMLFRDSRGDQVSEGSWVALNMYLDRVPGFYRHAMEQLPPMAGWNDEDREYALVTTCRAMLLMVRRKKLLHYAYRTVESDLWGHMNRVHARARVFGVHRKLTEPYAGLGEPTSVHNLYLAGMLFETAPLGGLLPTQMECLDLFLRRNAALIASADKPSAERPFFVDATKNQPPQRWLEGMAARANLFCFGPGKTHSTIETLRAEAADANEIPDWAVPSNCDLRAYRGLLEMLASYWSTKPPQRRHRRDISASEVLVAHGFAQVRRMVAITETAHSGEMFAGFETNKLMDDKYFNKIRFGSVNPDQTGRGKRTAAAPKNLSPREILETLETRGDKELLQRWIVLDTSDSGIGVMVPGRAPWAKLGVLVAYRLGDSLRWEVAIVRRLGRTAENKVAVGLERLAGATKSARALQFKGAIPEKWADLSANVENALEAVLVEGEVRLMLLPPGRYGESDCFLLSSGLEKYPVQLNGVWPSGADYQVVNYNRAGGYVG